MNRVDHRYGLPGAGRAKWRRLLLGALVLGMGGAWADPPVRVQVRPLREVAFQPELSAPATVVSLNDARIAAEVDGQVAELPVRVGDRVEAGTVLARLDCRDAEIQRTRLRGELHAFEAQAGLAEWRLRQAQTLIAQQSIPEEQVREYQARDAELRGSIEAQRARLAATERQLGQCVVKAPYPALVVERLAAQGQLATRGTPLARLVELGRAEIAAQIQDADIASIRQGDALVFEHGDTRYPVRLRAVLPLIHSETGSREARLEFRDGAAPPGATGRLLWKYPVLRLPADMLVKRGERYGVFVEERGVARFRSLPQARSGQPAPTDLPADARLIVSGHHGLSDGAAVEKLPDGP